MGAHRSALGACRMRTRQPNMSGNGGRQIPSRFMGLWSGLRAGSAGVSPAESRLRAARAHPSLPPLREKGFVARYSRLISGGGLD